MGSASFGSRAVERSWKAGCRPLPVPALGRPPRELHAHIEECNDRMQGFQLATEFRQQKWFDDEHCKATLAFERQHYFAHVVLDMPQRFSNSLPQIWEATSPDLTILRLHGRNTETWDIKGQTVASDRFNYDYSDDELGQFIEKMRGLAGHTALVQAIFNNNFEDQGQRNAAALKRRFDDDASGASNCALI